MDDKITRQEFADVAEIIEVREVSLFNNDIKMGNTRADNVRSLYAWEKRQRTRAAVATAKADRISSAAVHLLKGGAVAHE